MPSMPSTSLLVKCLTLLVCRYIINLKQFAKFVVALAEQVAPTDIEEGMRVGVVPHKFTISLPLPPKIDASVTMMQVRPCHLSCAH